jgi:hypothetical protein
VSVYPLGQEHLSTAVQAVRAELEAHTLRPEIGAMSTQVVGEAEAVFAALRDGLIVSPPTAGWLRTSRFPIPADNPIDFMCLRRGEVAGIAWHPRDLSGSGALKRLGTSQVYRSVLYCDLTQDANL